MLPPSGGLKVFGGLRLWRFRAGHGLWPAGQLVGAKLSQALVCADDFL